MTEQQLEESWHHECTGCGIMMTVAFELEDGTRKPMPAPEKKTGDKCILCGSPWSDWIAGDAPTDNDDEEIELCVGCNEDVNHCYCHILDEEG